MFKKYIYNHKKIFYTLLIFVLVLLTLPLIFNNNVWLDEVYTIFFIEGSWSEMQEILINDVHPPLYYYIAKIVTSIFGLNVTVLKVVSIIPITLIMVLGATVIDKYFGEKSLFVPIMFILSAFCAPHILTQAVELRMYSWAMFFVTATGLIAYVIYVKGFSVKLNTLLIVCGLGGAYTHYFALLSIAIIYLYLFIFMIAKNRINLKKCLQISAITIIGYLPWLFVFIEQLNRVSESYWITEPTMKGVLLYFISWLSSMNSWAITLSVVIVYGIIILINLIKNKKEYLTSKKTKSTLILAIIFMSIFFLTIILGIILSVIIRPIFIERYAYPCLYLLWLGILIFLNNLYENKVIKVVYIIILIISGIFSYSNEIKNADKNLVNVALECIDSIYKDGDIIASNLNYFNGNKLAGGLLEYYFNDKVTTSEFTDFSVLNAGESLFFFTGQGETPFSKEILLENNISEELILSSRMSTYYVDLYKYTKISQ